VYEKNRPDYKPRFVSAIAKSRNKKRRELAKSKGQYKRKKSSVVRTVQSFYRLCHHNVTFAKNVHFLTLTFAYDLSYKEAARFVRHFMEKIKSRQNGVPFSYISVPELTKKGRYHFHLLVFDLSTKVAGKEIRAGNAIYTTERETRNLQRLFERGYVDILPATYRSAGIAGYMAKYMAKAFLDERIEARRVYNCSRNIKKTRAFGSNTLSAYANLDDSPIPSEVDILQQTTYDVPYLGVCNFTKLKNKNL